MFAIKSTQDKAFFTKNGDWGKLSDALQYKTEAGANRRIQKLVHVDGVIPRSELLKVVDVEIEANPPVTVVCIKIENDDPSRTPIAHFTRTDGRRIAFMSTRDSFVQNHSKFKVGDVGVTQLNNYGYFVEPKEPKTPTCWKCGASVTFQPEIMPAGSACFFLTGPIMPSIVQWGKIVQTNRCGRCQRRTVIVFHPEKTII
jgi:hypothetical protein